MRARIEDREFCIPAREMSPDRSLKKRILRGSEKACVGEKAENDEEGED